MKNSKNVTVEIPQEDYDVLSKMKDEGQMSLHALVKLMIHKYVYDYKENIFPVFMDQAHFDMLEEVAKKYNISSRQMIETFILSAYEDEKKIS